MQQTGHRFESAQKWLDPVLFLTFTYGTVVYWLRRCWLSPDSTNYLIAAMNLLRHGRMFVLTNWPDYTLQPIEVLYKAQPFGFPLYLAAFNAVVHDPLFAALAAQSVAIILFYWGVWQFVKQTQLKLGLRVSLLLIIGSFNSFAQVFGHLWTETLFMGLTALLLASVHRGFRKAGGKRELALSATLLFLTSSLRFVGIFNLGFFLPALWRRKLHPTTFSALAGLALLPNVFWHFRNRLAEGANFETVYHWNLFAQSGAKLQNIAHSLAFALAYNQISLLAVFVILAILLFRSHRQRALLQGDSPALSMAPLVFAGAAVHFLGLTGIALTSEIGNLIHPQMEQARLLAPVYFLLFLWLHAAINALPKKGYLTGFILILALIGNREFFSFRSRLEFVPYVDYPSEYYLWPRLAQLPQVQRASHFYSDENFKHQVFSGKLQRILWNGAGLLNVPLSAQKSRLLELMQIGEHPFFLIQVNSKEWIQTLEAQRAATGLQRLDYPQWGHRLYYK